MLSPVFESTRMRSSDFRAADTPDVRLPAGGVEPVGRHRTVLRLDRASLPSQPGQHLHPLLRRPWWVDPVHGAASGA